MLFAKWAVGQGSELLSWQETCLPRWANYFHYLVCTNFLKPKATLFIHYILIFVVRIVMERTLKSSWHRWAQFSVLPIKLRGCRWVSFWNQTVMNSTCVNSHSQGYFFFKKPFWYINPLIRWIVSRRKKIHPKNLLKYTILLRSTN